MSEPHYLIVPGYEDSGPGHWQTLWQHDFGATRTAPSSWTEPEFTDWVAAVDAAMTPGAVILAHSLGCLATVAWLERNPGVAAGAFLVALPDAGAPDFPAGIRGFHRPGVTLADPTMTVASSDDPYCGIDYAREAAATIGATLVEIGAAGHISVPSGRGPWPEGRKLLADFVTGLALD